MGFKEKLDKSFQDIEKMNELRLKSATFMFVFMSFLFFLNYFFVGANFYHSVFIATLPYTYTLFLLACLLYFYYLFSNKFAKLGKPFRYGILAVGIVLFLLASLLFLY